jgi:ABC-type nitrate/sulfonate/bicarbonate transport system substrate-binding protein
MALSACGSDDNSASDSSASKSVRIISGGSESFSDGAVFKAVELLKAQGYKVTASVVDDPATALRAVVAGKADVALLDPVEGVKAVQNGDAPIKYIGTLSQATDYELVALPDVSLDDLAGKKFASAGPGTAGEVIAQAALAKQNVDFSKVHTVTVGGTSERVTAILAGQVDIAPVHAPDAVAAVKTGKVDMLLDLGSVLGQYLQQGMIASDDFVKNKAGAQAVVDAFIDAERFASTDQAGYLKIAKDNDLYGDLTDDEAAEAYQSLKDTKIFATNGAICEDAVQATLTYDYAVPDNGLTPDNTPAYDKWVDPTFVDAYVAKNSKDADGFC